MPGVVHKDVDAALRRERPRDEVVRLGGLLDVAAPRDGAAAGLLDPGGDGVERRLRAPAEHDRCALGGQAHGRLLADAAAGAGDDRDLSVQPFHTTSSYFTVLLSSPSPRAKRFMAATELSEMFES